VNADRWLRDRTQAGPKGGFEFARNHTAAFDALKVFDVLGAEVATLVDAFQDPGHHAATFDGSRLANGLYLYRLQVQLLEFGSGLARGPAHATL